MDTKASTSDDRLSSLCCKLSYHSRYTQSPQLRRLQRETPGRYGLTVVLQVPEVANPLLRITCVEVAVTYRKSGTWQHFLDSSKCRCWRERRATRVRYTCSRCSSDHDRLETQNEHHSSNQTLERETLKQVPISCRRFARRLLSSPF